MTHALAFVRTVPPLLRIKTHRATVPAIAARHHNSEADKSFPETSFRPFDMHQLRRAFPARWGEFCRRNFRDVEHLALFMGVEERTARYWLEGKHAPAAPFVLRAVTAFPDAAAFLAEAA